MQSKSDKIRAALDAGDSVTSLNIAAKFFDRGPDTKLYQQGKAAFTNPGFYRQLGKDPGVIVDSAIARLKEVFCVRLP